MRQCSLNYQSIHALNSIVTTWNKLSSNKSQNITSSKYVQPIKDAKALFLKVYNHSEKLEPLKDELFRRIEQAKVGGWR